MEDNQQTHPTDNNYATPPAGSDLHLYSTCLFPEQNYCDLQFRYITHEESCTEKLADKDQVIGTENVSEISTSTENGQESSQVSITGSNNEVIGQQEVIPGHESSWSQEKTTSEVWNEEAISNQEQGSVDEIERSRSTEMNQVELDQEVNRSSLDVNPPVSTNEGCAPCTTGPSEVIAGSTQVTTGSSRISTACSGSIHVNSESDLTSEATGPSHMSESMVVSTSNQITMESNHYPGPQAIIDSSEQDHSTTESENHDPQNMYQVISHVQSVESQDSNSLNEDLNTSVSSLDHTCDTSVGSPLDITGQSLGHCDSPIDKAQDSQSSLADSGCHDTSIAESQLQDYSYIPYRPEQHTFYNLQAQMATTYAYTPTSYTFEQPTRRYHPYGRDVIKPGHVILSHDSKPSHMMQMSHDPCCHDDSGIDVSAASSRSSFYSFQPSAPDTSLVDWLSRNTQLPLTARQQQKPATPPREKQKKTSETSEKPPDTYISLISQAILNSTEQRMILSDIYKYIKNTYPYYQNADDTWKNAIRHNLSVNECFVKNGRAPNGRGYYWSIHPACVRSFLEGDFRRREARRLAREANKTREVEHPPPAGRGRELSTSTPRRGRSVTLAKVMGLPSPSPLMPASPALVPMTTASYYNPATPQHMTHASPSLQQTPIPHSLPYHHPFLSYYNPPSSPYTLSYPTLPSPISQQASYNHMTGHVNPHVNPASFSLGIPTIYGNLPSSSMSSLSALPKND